MAISTTEEEIIKRIKEYRVPHWNELRILDVKDNKTGMTVSYISNNDYSNIASFLRECRDMLENKV